MPDYLHQLHSSETNRRQTLLQGVSASAIAFAIHETADRVFSQSLLFIAVAVLAWAISFGAGIVFSHEIQSAINSNSLRNDALAQGDGPGAKISEEFAKRYTRRAGAAQSIQQWALLIGAVLYVIGHGIHIRENSVVATTVATSSTSQVKASGVVHNVPRQPKPAG